MWISENTTDNGISKVSGKIVGALTGNGLANVTLELYSGWGTMQGTVVTTITSDESGNYEVSLERGYYTIKAMKEEYISLYKNVISFTNYNTREQNIAITPILLSDDEYRIVLTWGATPSD